MDRYYLHVMELLDGSYEIHKANCLKLPTHLDLTFLGEFSNSKLALAEAEKLNVKTVPCIYCERNLSDIYN